MENYKLIKLRSGESLIADLKSITDYKTIVLDRPMYYRVVTVLDHKNSYNSDLLVFKNYNEFSKDTVVELPMDYIATILNPNEDMTNFYEVEKKKQDVLNQPIKLEDSEIIPEDILSLPHEILDQMLNGFTDEINPIKPSPKRKKKAKKLSNPKDKTDPTWGNKYTDWPTDPHDLL